MHWRWENEEVLEAWAATRTRQQKQTVFNAMRRAVRQDPDDVPGEMVGTPLDPYRRVIETDVANIYFTTHGHAWNSRHDRLYLLAIE